MQVFRFLGGDLPGRMWILLFISSSDSQIYVTMRNVLHWPVPCKVIVCACMDKLPFQAWLVLPHSTPTPYSPMGLSSATAGTPVVTCTTHSSCLFEDGVLRLFENYIRWSSGSFCFNSVVIVADVAVSRAEGIAKT